MPLNEIDDRAEAHAVDHVAQRAAHDQRQGEREQFLFGVTTQFQRDPAGNGKRQHGEEPALPARLVGQEAEGGTRVVGQHPVPERRDVDRLAELDVVQHHPLADLVEDDDQPGDAEPWFAAGHGQASQSSISKPGTRENSAVLWVTRMAPCASAVAAMSKSLGPMSWPFDVNSARIKACR